MYASEQTISESINYRFFIAVENLIESGKINSLHSFCADNKLSSPRYREMRLTYGIKKAPHPPSRYKNIEIEAIYCLIKKYNVSAKWLLTGEE